jgi:hypothetical protein
MKSKLTPQLQKEIGNNITLGMPLKFASEAAGVPERTFYQWLEYGGKQEYGKYHDFLLYCDNCKSKAVQLHLKLITKAASSGSWQASAWILERRHPEDFGRKDKLELDGKMKHSVNVVLHLPRKDSLPGIDD